MSDFSQPLERLVEWQELARKRSLLRRLFWVVWNWLVGDDPHPAEAVVLATTDLDGNPAARMVLVKHIDERGPRFFTNYASRKAKELANNPKATLLFYWPHLARQVRVDGTVEKLDHEATLAYWKTRPRGSKIGAWASKQSEVMASKSILKKRLADEHRRFQHERDVPCPPFWGGYRLVPERFEFWTGKVDRLHDRECFEWRDGAWQHYLRMP